eukprot:10984531-Lingulodinium_polyedra.AAC.1
MPPILGVCLAATGKPYSILQHAAMRAFWRVGKDQIAKAAGARWSPGVLGHGPGVVQGLGGQNPGAHRRGGARAPPQPAGLYLREPVARR